MKTSTVDLSFVDAPAAESIDNAKPIVIRDGMLNVGQFFPQGDVGMELLAKVPDDAIPVENFSLQVTEGNTQGSRHCWDSRDGIEAFRLGGSNPLRGLVYRLSQTRTLTHPEHADQTYEVGDTPIVFGTRYQRAHAEELRRVQD